MACCTFFSHLYILSATQRIQIKSFLTSSSLLSLLVFVNHGPVPRHPCSNMVMPSSFFQCVFLFIPLQRLSLSLHLPSHCHGKPPGLPDDTLPLQFILRLEGKPLQLILISPLFTHFIGFPGPHEEAQIQAPVSVLPRCDPPPCFSNISPKSVLIGVMEVLCRVMEHLDVLSAQLLCTLEHTVLFAWNLLYLPPFPHFFHSRFSHLSQPIRAHHSYYEVSLSLLSKIAHVSSLGYHSTS